MNIVKISAGLGNQIFQYAFYRALKKNIADTKMDIREFMYRRHHNGYELEKVFNIVPHYATKDEISRLADVSKDLISTIRRDFLKIVLKTYGSLVDESVIGNRYHPELLLKQDTYFAGFWQSEKYFEPIEKELRDELTFKNPLDKVNSEIARLIESTHSVSVHIRRGDYVKARRRDTCGSVCTPRYYNDAIALMRSKSRDSRFIVFSDDIGWVKENLPIPDALYVDNNKGSDSYKDMQLMSLCKHNIIANSSFSWWGAWLNNNKEKTVIAPAIWMRDNDFADIVPDGWTRIAVE